VTCNPKKQLNDIADTSDTLFIQTGLSKTDLNLIQTTIKKYTLISDAYIFGSRAKGNYKAGSDIDIAICFENNTDNTQHKNILFKLHDELEETLNIPYFFDLVDFNSIEKQTLIDHINRVGVPLI